MLVDPILMPDAVGALASRLSAIEELLRASHAPSPSASLPETGSDHLPFKTSAHEVAVQSLEEAALSNSLGAPDGAILDSEKLTSARTSIIGASWTDFCITKSSVSWIMELGLDFETSASFDQLEEEWKSAMAKLHGLLPEKSLCYHLVAKVRHRYRHQPAAYSPFVPTVPRTARLAQSHSPSTNVRCRGRILLPTRRRRPSA